MFSIRPIQPNDTPSLMGLVKELAEFEKALHAVTLTPEQMLKDGFGENPLFGGYVVETENHDIVAMAIYYYRYSTWKGKVLYLEDLYIQPSYRRFGIGKMLFDRLILHAQQHNCQRVTWQVLDWNEPAVKFYEKIGATIDKEWWNGYLEV